MHTQASRLLFWRTDGNHFPFHRKEERNILSVTPVQPRAGGSAIAPSIRGCSVTVTAHLFLFELEKKCERRSSPGSQTARVQLKGQGRKCKSQLPEAELPHFFRAYIIWKSKRTVPALEVLQNGSRHCVLAPIQHDSLSIFLGRLTTLFFKDLQRGSNPHPAPARGSHSLKDQKQACYTMK